MYFILMFDTVVIDASGDYCAYFLATKKMCTRDNFRVNSLRVCSLDVLLSADKSCHSSASAFQCVSDTWVDLFALFTRVLRIGRLSSVCKGCVVRL